LSLIGHEEPIILIILIIIQSYFIQVHQQDLALTQHSNSLPSHGVSVSAPNQKHLQGEYYYDHQHIIRALFFAFASLIRQSGMDLLPATTSASPLRETSPALAATSSYQFLFFLWHHYRIHHGAQMMTT
jgi:hypothetical protein